jgi:peptidoglycan lytic transglycosylase
MRMRPLGWFVVPALVLTIPSDAAQPGQATSRPRSGSNQSRRAHEVREGLASYYSQRFDGRRAAGGDRFENDAMVAAHPTYPLGSIVRVTNLRNRRSVSLQIVDRGPARHLRARGVIIDVSRAAAQALDFIHQGRTRVRVEMLRWGPTH